MVDIIKKFSKHLTAVEYPKQKTSWNIAGIITGQNAFYKFDVEALFVSKVAPVIAVSKGVMS